MNQTAPRLAQINDTDLDVEKHKMKKVKRLFTVYNDVQKQ